MGLSKAQRGIWERARSLGNSHQAAPLTDEILAYLIGRIAADLGFSKHFPEILGNVPDYYGKTKFSKLVVKGVSPLPLFERLVDLEKDADTYLACLASLHKGRLKYERILQSQPFPTMEQVGPRGLLQYGQLSAGALATLLYWRKWFYDIDNRAGQETGYLFEPILASAIGGTAVPASRSPIKRHNGEGKGRQVDCLLSPRAYEFKIRVTIASSGQGRWKEEMDFPVDCRASKFVPVLVVLDSTANPKLEELQSAFLAAGGEVYIGDSAWQHLRTAAGRTMGRFIETYVRQPLQELLSAAPEGWKLRPLTAKGHDGRVVINVGNEELVIERLPTVAESEDIAEIPDDAVEE
jgi:hypothetical protein